MRNVSQNNMKLKIKLIASYAGSGVAARVPVQTTNKFISSLLVGCIRLKTAEKLNQNKNDTKNPTHLVQFDE